MTPFQKWAYQSLIAIIVYGVLSAVRPAFSGEASPTPAPTATSAPAAAPADPVPSMPSTIWLEVNQADLTLISQALGQMQYGAVAPLVLKLNAQLAAQAKITENKDTAEKAKGKRK